MMQTGAGRQAKSTAYETMTQDIARQSRLQTCSSQPGAFKTRLSQETTGTPQLFYPLTIIRRVPKGTEF